MLVPRPLRRTSTGPYINYGALPESHLRGARRDSNIVLDPAFSFPRCTSALRHAHIATVLSPVQCLPAMGCQVFNWQKAGLTAGFHVSVRLALYPTRLPCSASRFVIWLVLRITTRGGWRYNSMLLRSFGGDLQHQRHDRTCSCARSHGNAGALALADRCIPYPASTRRQRMLRRCYPVLATQLLLSF